MTVTTRRTWEVTLAEPDGTQRRVLVPADQVEIDPEPDGLLRFWKVSSMNVRELRALFSRKAVISLLSVDAPE